MLLTVRDVATILRVPETTVHRWVQEDGLPALEINGQYRTNPLQLLEWSARRHVSVGPEAFQFNGHPEIARLDEAIQAGGIVYNLPGWTQAEVFHALVKYLPLPGWMYPDDLLNLLIGREESGSTYLGDGIALPHPRYPLVRANHPPAVTLSFLDRPVPWGADGRLVSVLFTLLSPNVRAHLRLLSRLVSALKDPSFREVLDQQASRGEILDAARKLDAPFAQPANGHPWTARTSDRTSAGPSRPEAAL